MHVAGFVEELTKSRSAPSVKQSLAAVRMLYDWLVVGQVVRSNPASVVRGPKHVVKRGKTPILDPTEARKLFDSIPQDSLVGLRDRSLRCKPHLQSVTYPRSFMSFTGWLSLTG